MMKFLVLLPILFFISSCETGKTTDSPAFTFEPGTEKAILVPNARSGCADYYNAEVDAAAGTGAATLAISIKGFSAAWNNIHVKWADPRELNIAFVQVEFISTLLDGGRYSVFLDAAEISVLLGLGLGEPIPGNFEVFSAKKTATAAADGIVNCGLNIGSLKPAAKAKGIARGYIRIAGTAVDASGVEEFIRETVPITLQVEDF